MTVECTPDVAREVARRLTDSLDGVDTAATSLLTTSAVNGTTAITTGLPSLARECVEEAGLVASVLSNLASSVEFADIFPGAGTYFADQAARALEQLLGSLSDGRGDLGGDSPRRRYDGLTDEIWPNGIPSGLSDDELVATVMDHPRSATMTPAELASIWPFLPRPGRETYAGARPVAVLNLVVDGGLDLTSKELDAAARSVIASPPTVDVEISSDLRNALDLAGKGRWGLPSPDRAGVALDRADVLMAAGAEGRAYRDATNHPITYLALVIGLQAGGKPERTDDGLIVVTVPRGAQVSIDDALGTDISGRSVQPYAKGGTTYGNTFVVPEDSDDPPDADLLHHENIHTYQWAGAGPLQYGPLYGAESVKSGVRDFVESVDVDTVKVDVGPVGPRIPSVKIPFGDRIPFVPDRTPSVGLQVDPPSIEIPVGVNVDATFDTGCDNRFEQHAGLDDGGYHSCER